MKQAPFLGFMEWRHPDKDGGTTEIQEWLRKGRIRLDTEEAVKFKAKYGHLAPIGYAGTPPAMFEAEWLEDNDTSRLYAQMQSGRYHEGRDIFLGAKADILEKHQPVRELDALIEFELRYDTLSIYGDKLVKEALTKGFDVFKREPETVTKKYGYMRKGFDLYVFERKHEVWECGTERIEMELEQGNNVLEGEPEEVMEKYGHLMSHYIPRQESLQE